MSRARRDAGGSITVLVVAIAALILWLGAALGVAAAMVRAHRMAESAADLAALAGARALQQGGRPCSAAADIATANASRLTTCRLSGSTVTVEVVVAGPRWLGQDGDLVGRSRAGPG